MWCVTSLVSTEKLESSLVTRCCIASQGRTKPFPTHTKRRHLCLRTTVAHSFEPACDTEHNSLPCSLIVELHIAKISTSSVPRHHYNPIPNAAAAPPPFLLNQYLSHRDPNNNQPSINLKRLEPIPSQDTASDDIPSIEDLHIYILTSSIPCSSASLLTDEHWAASTSLYDYDFIFIFGLSIFVCFSDLFFYGAVGLHGRH